MKCHGLLNFKELHRGAETIIKWGGWEVFGAQKGIWMAYLKLDIDNNIITEEGLNKL